MPGLRQHAARCALALVVLAALLGHAARVYEIPFIRQLDAMLYDARVRLTLSNRVDERVVILDIDEKSLAELGRWPWGRDRMAALVDKLFDRYQPRLVGFDMVFAEPDDSSGLKVLEALAAADLKDDTHYLAALQVLRPRLDTDRLFARALQGRPVVLAYYLSGEDGVSTGALPEPVLPAGTFKGRGIPFTTWANHGGNLSVLHNAAARAGHIAPIVDADGIVRRVPLVVEYDGNYYESLSLAMVRALLGFPALEPWYPEEKWFSSRHYKGMEALVLPTARGRLSIPVDENAAALVPFRGPRGSFPYYSVVDVLTERVPPSALNGKVVLVGTTAPALFDLRATPLGSVYPGVEMHANLITGMLDGKIKERPAYVLGAEVALLALFGLVMVFAPPLLSPQHATLATLGVLGASIGINFALWHYGNLVLPLATLLLMVALLFALHMSYGYFVESRAKRQFAGLFGQYVPPELVEEMSRNPGKYTMEGRNAELTVLFSDIRGFTTLSESLPPEQLKEMLNEYLTEMTAVIGRHRGTLDKYIGDAIMAFWGAPVADDAHASQAVRAALQMQAALARLNPRLLARGWPELKIGVGLNTGMVTVGDMGSALRKAYTVIGDAVNLASRLEALTKEYGAAIVVGEATRNAVEGVVFRELDRVQVKGKEESTTIFEPLGLEGEVAKAAMEELRLWHQTLRHYRARDWDQAEVGLLNLTRLAPECRLYAVYAERLAAYRKAPPHAGWNGVTRFETK